MVPTAGGYDLGVSVKADGLHRSVREIKTNQSSQSLNEAGSLTKVARFFCALFAGRGNFPLVSKLGFFVVAPSKPKRKKKR